MAINAVSLVMVLSYYALVLFLGVWSGRRARSRRPSIAASKLESADLQSNKDAAGYLVMQLFVANRHMPLFLGALTMTATWFGGGYLNGTAEAVYHKGILHCYAPIGYAFSLIIGGVFFAEKMRETNPVTMLDPLQSHYGRWVGSLLCLPAVCGEVFWSAAVLAALGDTARVIMEVDSQFFTIASAMVVFFYTSLGGLYATTYTDILQLGTAAVFLSTCVPFCLNSPFVGKVGAPDSDWVGAITPTDAPQLFDIFLMIVLGGIPWQSYFQRIVSCETHFIARMISFISAVGCLFLSIPAVTIGATARSANFTAAGYMGPARLLDKDHGSVLPLSLRYLTPEFVSVLGMVGITAAIMSSVDSSMLSAASIVTRNAYEVIFRRSKSDLQVAQTLRLAIWMIGSCATYLALQVRSVLKLWIFSSEFVYVLLFPHFLCVFYFKKTNAYGSLLAFILGASFRLMCGEPSVNLPVIIKLPLYDEEAGQRFPFRLTGMCLCLVTLLVGSYVATALFEEGRLSQRWDVLQCFKKKAPGTVELKHDGTTQLSRSEPAIAAKEEFPTNAATAKDKVSVDTDINVSDCGVLSATRKKSELTLGLELKPKAKSEVPPLTRTKSQSTQRRVSSKPKSTDSGRGSAARKASRITPVPE